MSHLDTDQPLGDRAMVAVTALFCSGAIGALWSLLTLPRPWLFDPLAPLCGLALAATLRLTAPRGLYRSILAVLGTLLASGYASSIGASARLANELGLSLGAVLATNGLHTSLQLGWDSLHARDAIWLASACAIAWIVTQRRSTAPNEA
ncbi:MAG TPA: hypothetical protein VFN09_02025 [Rhodanobacteraceae bacterium]|nr:hypothetical protein [Rhodanobacteraceae bacterium]